MKTGFSVLALSRIPPNITTPVFRRSPRSPKHQKISEFVVNLNLELENLLAHIQKVQCELKKISTGIDRAQVMKDVASILRISKNLKTSGISSTIKQQIDNMINELEKTLQTVFLKSSKQGKNTVQKAVGVSSHEIGKTDSNKRLFMSCLKECAKEMLREGPKSDFDIKSVLNYLDKKHYRYSPSSYDAEKQKLAKTAVDLIQKQYVFDEVIKIIEEEKLDVESLFLAAFEKLNTDVGTKHSARSAKTFTDDNSNLSDMHILDENSSRYSEQKMGDLNHPVGGLQLDLEAVYQRQQDDELEGKPSGFHQQFMSNLDQFSLSWRKQAEAEMQREKDRIAERNVSYGKEYSRDE